MRKLRCLLAVGAIAMASTGPSLAETTAPATVAATPTLYKRLGGYDALAAVTDDFLARPTGDPQFARLFAGHSSDSLKHIRKLVVDQLCAATGGP